MADLYGLLLEDLLRGRPPRVPRPFNPDHLLWRAGEHGLHGLVRAALDRAGPSAPPVLLELSPRLRALAMAQEASVRVNLAAAKELAGDLAGNGIPAVFIKGAALAPDVYESLDLRPFSDLDLLLPPAEVGRGVDCIRGLGYSEDTTVEPSRMERRFVRGARPRIGTGVDLHWDLVEPTGSQAAVRIPVAEIVARARTVGGMPVPTIEDSLLLGAVNLVRSRVDRLVLLADFDRLARRGPDWRVVSERALLWRLRCALWLGLEQAERVLGSPVPRPILDGLRPSPVRGAWIRMLLHHRILWTRRKFKRRIWSGVFPFACADSWSDMILDLRACADRLLPREG